MGLEEAFRNCAPGVLSHIRAKTHAGGAQSHRAHAGPGVGRLPGFQDRNHRRLAALDSAPGPARTPGTPPPVMLSAEPEPSKPQRLVQIKPQGRGEGEQAPTPPPPVPPLRRPGQAAGRARLSFPRSVQPLLLGEPLLPSPPRRPRQIWRGQKGNDPAAGPRSRKEMVSEPSPSPQGRGRGLALQEAGQTGPSRWAARL